MKRIIAIFVGIVLAAVISTSMVHAESSKAKKKGLWGAGIGAVAGGLITGNIYGTAAAAIAGGGLGYVMGNEEDKKTAQAQAAKERQARAKAQVTGDPKTAYRPPATNPFVGSSWRVISLVSDFPFPEYASMVVTFASNSKLTTMAVKKDGTAENWVESYRIVEDVLVVSGKDPETDKPYVFSFKYSVEGNQMVGVAPESRFVLEKLGQS